MKSNKYKNLIDKITERQDIINLTFIIILITFCSFKFLGYALDFFYLFHFYL